MPLSVGSMIVFGSLGSLSQRKVGSTLGHLGLQDAACKHWEPRQDPGAWSGSVILSSGETPELQVSLEKWLKNKDLISK